MCRDIPGMYMQCIWDCLIHYVEIYLKCTCSVQQSCLPCWPSWLRACGGSTSCSSGAGAASGTGTGTGTGGGWTLAGGGRIQGAGQSTPGLGQFVLCPHYLTNFHWLRWHWPTSLNDQRKLLRLWQTGPDRHSVCWLADGLREGVLLFNHRQHSIPSTAWKSPEKVTEYKPISGEERNSWKPTGPWLEVGPSEDRWLAGGDIISGLPLRLEVGPFWKTKDILEYKNLPIGSPFSLVYLNLIEFTLIYQNLPEFT